MKYVIFTLLFFFIPCNANLLLTKPEPCSSEQLQELVQQWHTEFTWCWRNSIDLAECTFRYEEQSPSFAFKVLKVPVYWHKYRMMPKWQDVKEFLSLPSYFFTDPLHVEGGSPQKASLKMMVNLVKNKNVVFYTGAGISACADVPTMDGLEKDLEMDRGTYHLLKALWKRPQKIAEAFGAFCTAAIYGEPTPAHHALARIASAKEVAIITENLDLLHQRSGIKPLHAQTNEVRAVSRADIRAVDAIVCIGLSHDDRGLLAWYKKHNPRGIIVALDIQKPDYLSDYDFLWQEDLQEVLVQLEQEVCTQRQ